MEFLRVGDKVKFIHGSETFYVISALPEHFEIGLMDRSEAWNIPNKYITKVNYNCEECKGKGFISLFLSEASCVPCSDVRNISPGDNVKFSHKNKFVALSLHNVNDKQICLTVKDENDLVWKFDLNEMDKID